VRIKFVKRFPGPCFTVTLFRFLGAKTVKIGGLNWYRLVPVLQTSVYIYLGRFVLLFLHQKVGIAQAQYIAFFIYDYGGSPK
jgi:hypothetical protein